MTVAPGSRRLTCRRQCRERWRSCAARTQDAARSTSATARTNHCFRIDRGLRPSLNDLKKCIISVSIVKALSLVGDPVSRPARSASASAASSGLVAMPPSGRRESLRAQVPSDLQSRQPLTSCSSPSIRYAPTRSARSGGRRRDALDGSPGRCRHPFRPGARPQRRDAAVAREHPRRPAPPQSRRPRQLRVPFPADGRRSRRSSSRAAIAPARSSAPSRSTRGSDSSAASTCTTTASSTRARSAFLIQERRGAETVALARRWMDRQEEQPWFAGSISTSRTIRTCRTTYADDVARRSTRRWRRSSSPILAAGRRSPTLVVLTSDHGESLGEHGEATHGISRTKRRSGSRSSLSPALLKPGVIAEGGRHIDILPTVLAALSVPSPRDSLGDAWPCSRRLCGLCGPCGTRETGLLRGLSGSPQPRVGARLRPRQGSIRYIDLPIPELYDLRNDPQDKNLALGRPTRRGDARPSREFQEPSAPPHKARSRRTPALG